MVAENVTIKIGDFVIVRGQRVRISYISLNKDVFEWNGGWAYTNQLVPNPNTKSKVKFVLVN